MRPYRETEDTQFSTNELLLSPLAGSERFMFGFLAPTLTLVHHHPA